MTSEKSVQQILQESFPSPGKEKWIQTATAELDGKDPFKELLWHDGDSLSFFPYYDQNDVRELDYLHRFHFHPDQDSYLGPRTWHNLPHLLVSDETKSNLSALQHLSQGADGILFNLSQHKNTNLSKLLDKIEWPYCTISFQTANGNLLLTNLFDYIDKKSLPPHISGAIFWEESPGNTLSIPPGFERIKKLGIHITSSTPVQEISQALLTGVKLIRDVTRYTDVKTTIGNIAFSLPVGTNFFLEQAKFKAMRLLWFQVAHAYGVKDFKAGQLHIHARGETWTPGNYQPHGNMLKSTTSAMSAIMGGCDALTVLAEDENNAIMSRVARNVSNLLREESHLNKVADPMAGSYALENMVHQLAEQAWKKFQLNLQE